MLKDKRPQSPKQKSKKKRNEVSPFKLDDTFISNDLQPETFSQWLVASIIIFLENIFFERGNYSMIESSSCQSQRSLLPTTDEVQSSFMKFLMLPVTVPYSIFAYFISLPIKFADSIVSMGLRKLKMTKGDARVYAKKMAKKQVMLMRNFCLIMVLFVSLFSVSLGVSTTAYAGVYLYLIPELTHEVQVYFNYVPVD